MNRLAGIVGTALLAIVGASLYGAVADNGQFAPDEGTLKRNIRIEQDTILRLSIDEGDCRPADCQRNRERSELTSIRHKTDVGQRGARIRYSIEVFFPADFRSPRNGMGITIFQVKVPGSHPALDLFMRSSGDLRVKMDHAYKLGDWDEQQSVDRQPIILPGTDLRGRWHHIVVDAHWAGDKAGMVEISVNGESAFAYRGRNIAAGRSVYSKFGLYRWDIDRDPARGRSEILFRKVVEEPV